MHLFADAHSAPVAELADAQRLPPALAVAAWYANHLAPPFPILVLSDALAAAFPAGSDLEAGLLPAGVRVVSAAALFSAAHFPSAPRVTELYDSLAAREAAAEAGQGPVRAHSLSDAALQEGLLDGTLTRGVLAVSKRRPEEATVRSADGACRTVFLYGKEARGNAVHGDTVAVRLLPPSQWRRPAALDIELEAFSMAVAGAEGGGDEGAAEGDTGAAGGAASDDDDDEAAIAASPAPQGAVPTGVLAGVLTRAAHEFVACLAAEEEEAMSLGAAGTSGADETQTFTRLLCIPMDRRLPLCRLRTRRGGALRGTRFVLRLDSWPRDAPFPDAHLVRILGRTGDLETELAALLATHDIAVDPFCPAALAELPPPDWTPSAEEIARRRDMRGARTASIDPPGCTDVDDALSVGPRADGRPGFEIGVHIADVSFFVRQGGVLDAEAAARGTTVYLVRGRPRIMSAPASRAAASFAGRPPLRHAARAVE